MKVICKRTSFSKDCFPGSYLKPDGFYLHNACKLTKSRINVLHLLDIIFCNMYLTNSFGLGIGYQKRNFLCSWPNPNAQLKSKQISFQKSSLFSFFFVIFHVGLRPAAFGFCSTDSVFRLAHHILRPLFMQNLKSQPLTNSHKDQSRGWH